MHMPVGGPCGTIGAIPQMWSVDSSRRLVVQSAVCSDRLLRPAAKTGPRWVLRKGNQPRGGVHRPDGAQCPLPYAKSRGLQSRRCARRPWVTGMACVAIPTWSGAKGRYNPCKIFWNQALATSSTRLQSTDYADFRHEKRNNPWKSADKTVGAGPLTQVMRQAECVETGCSSPAVGAPCGCPDRACAPVSLVPCSPDLH